MRLADHYDAICAGSGLSSYLCAALLARAGKTVLVVDDEDQALPRVHRARSIYDPDLGVVGGLHGTGALMRSLAELEIHQDESLFRSQDALVQVLTPEYRVMFPADPEMAQHEIARELREARPSASRFFETLYRAGTGVPSFIEDACSPSQGSGAENRSWKKFWGPHFRVFSRRHPIALRRVIGATGAEECERLGAAILGAVSYTDPMNLGAEQCFRALSLPFQGQALFIGGVEALKSRLAKIIVAAGGHVKRDARIESLISESRKITGALLSSYEGIVRAEILIMSSRLRRLYSTLPADIQDPSLVRSLGRVLPNSWRFTLSLAVNRSVLPSGSTRSMAYVGSGRFPLLEDNFLRIQVLPDELYPESVDGETVTLLVTALVPYRASTLDYGYLRRLGGKMMQVLTEVMPFLEENVVGVYPDIRSGEDELRALYPFRSLDWLPENLLMYYVRGHRAVQDFWGPSWTTPHSNLYFAGRSIWPSLGVYGEALVARKVYEDIVHSGAMKKESRRD